MKILLRAALALGAATALVVPAASADAQKPRPAVEDEDGVVRRRPTRKPAAAPAPAPVVPMSNTAGTARRGRYRVTLTGFTVFRQTQDNALQIDGKGDEVFISTDVKILDGASNRIIQGFDPKVPSYVFGDVNGRTHDRNLFVQAGSLSDRGGLANGDEYPRRDPYVSTPVPGPRRLPLVLWEGELVEGQNAVVVTPTVWEWDGSNNADAFNSWLRWARETADKLQNSKEFNQLIGGQGTTVLALTKLGAEIALSFSGVMGVDADRPIGVTRNGDKVEFLPQHLALNYGAVEQFLSGDHRVASLPTGVYPVQYVDSGDWGGGNYTLYLKIERVP